MDLRSPRLDPDDPELRQAFADIVLDDPSAVLFELRDVAAAGGRTIVEVSTASMGRRPDALRAASVASGVHIVCATGIYTREFHPPTIATASIDELAAEMIREIDHGIAGTGIRAGVIKLASSVSPLACGERKAFQAGGRAQVATGAAITTHTSPGPAFALPGGTMGLEQLDILEGEGVDPARVIIGHCDLNPQPDHHLALARRGAYVQLDHVGSSRFSSDERRVEAVLSLFEHGHGDRVLLSHDLARPTDDRARGGLGRAFALRELVPRLQQAGLGDRELQLVLVENPARVLTRPGPRS
jgi:phosphotriesterase-related protein